MEQLLNKQVPLIRNAPVPAWKLDVSTTSVPCLHRSSACFAAPYLHRLYAACTLSRASSMQPNDAAKVTAEQRVKWTDHTPVYTDLIIRKDKHDWASQQVITAVTKHSSFPAGMSRPKVPVTEPL